MLEQAAHGGMHTPYLYSCLLRALISAKTDSDAGGLSGADAGSHDAATLAGAFSSGANPLAEFQFDSEMGPVADMSTFPPTMAPFPTEDNFGMLTMDSILSSGFWDSVLVPGKSSPAPFGVCVP